MDLRQLRYFLAVVEHGGVHRAATALHVAQPSLSQSIRKLEKDLQTELFHRVGRGLVLAPAGEALVGPARQMLRDLSSAQEAVRQVGEVEAGRVDIASLADLSSDPASTWVAQFRVRNPRVAVRVEERGHVSQVAELVRSGECEVGLGVLPMPQDGLVHERLSSRHFLFIAPPGTDRQFGTTVTLPSLQGVPLVMGERHATTRDWVEAELRVHDVEPRISVEVPQRGAVLPLVLNGAGAAIVPLRMGLDAHHRGAVVREIHPPLQHDIGAIYRPGSLTAGAAAFLECTRDQVGSWDRAVERRMAEGKGRVEASALTDLAVRRRQLAEFRSRSPVARPPIHPSHDR